MWISTHYFKVYTSATFYDIYNPSSEKIIHLIKHDD